MPTVAGLSSGRSMAASANRSKLLRQILSNAGIPCEISADIQKIQWTKLLWNAPFCAIGCLAYANVKQIVESESLTALALDCMTEVQDGRSARATSNCAANSSMRS